ncbi:MAG TPA: hypothetical protein VF665_24065 [Longimicrobium sp.]|jgi:hypothetical protein|uniref:hypothetical protein n=1 Tax=Longimicrobium sp. TaxID=2029185 RepID=UPI002EDA31D0
MTQPDAGRTRLLVVFAFLLLYGLVLSLLRPQPNSAQRTFRIAISASVAAGLLWLARVK